MNSQLDSNDIEVECQLSSDDSHLLSIAVDRMGLSARGYYRVLRVARTIADLAAEIDIAKPHLMEALGYRSM